MTRGPLGLAALAAAFLAIAATARAGEPSGREVRRLGLVAFAEAAVDGPPGTAAVIRVVRNRAADPDFPDDACAAVAQVAQFQPVARSAVLRRVVRDPEGYDIPRAVGAQAHGADRRARVPGRAPAGRGAGRAGARLRRGRGRPPRGPAGAACRGDDGGAVGVATAPWQRGTEIPRRNRLFQLQHFRGFRRVAEGVQQTGNCCTGKPTSAPSLSKGLARTYPATCRHRSLLPRGLPGLGPKGFRGSKPRVLPLDDRALFPAAP